MTNRWVQVVGDFDSENGLGNIVGVQPARAEYKPPTPAEGSLSLAVLDGKDKVLSEVPVQPEFGSCGDDVKVATFQAFVETPEAAHAISLRLKGKEISRRVPSASAEPAVESFGLGPQEDHTVPVVLANPPDPDATYTLQARGKGDAIWQTIDIGFDHPDIASVDVNQFLGAKGIEVRLLKSKGFDTLEINRAEIEFDK